MLEKVKAKNGILKFLTRFEIDNRVFEGRYHFNELLLDYAYDVGMFDKFKRSNNINYTGDYDPSLYNCSIITQDFRKFLVWCHDNYKVKQYA